MQINIVIHPHLYAEETTMDWILAEDDVSIGLKKPLGGADKMLDRLS